MFPDGSGHVFNGDFSLRLDDLGFTSKKLLEVEAFGPFNDEESH